MSTWEPVTKFLFDSKPHVSTKAAIVVFIVIGVIVTDNIFGYSAYYNSGRKIEQLEKINALLKDSTNDPVTRAYAENLRKKVMERSDFVQQIIPVIKGFNFEKVVNNNPGSTRSNVWFHLSAAGLFYLLAIIRLIFPFVESWFSLREMATGILHCVVLLIVGLLLYWLFNFIPPLLASTWLWNYLLIFVLQIGAIVIYFRVSQDV